MKMSLGKVKQVSHIPEYTKCASYVHTQEGRRTGADELYPPPTHRIQGLIHHVCREASLLCFSDRGRVYKFTLPRKS